MDENQKNYSRSIFYILLFLAFIVFVSILKVTQAFIVPVTVAILLSLVFYPSIKQMNQIKIPWIVGIFIMVLVSAVAFYLVGNLLISSLRTILSTYPKYESRFISLYTLFAQTFNINYDEESSLFANLWNQLGVRNAVQNLAINLSSFAITSVKTISMIFLLVIFLLIEMRGMKTKVQEAFPKEGTSRKITYIITKIIAEVTRYISIKFLVSLITGLLVYLCTLAVKMDFPVIWGFLAFILNFIPTFGSIFSWGITTLFAILQFWPNWGIVVFISGTVLAINMILGNVVEPRWEGNDLGLSPFIILVNLLIWGWMWGFVGMILSVPAMVLLKIVCENIDYLKPIAVIIGSNTKQKKNHRSLKKR